MVEGMKLIPNLICSGTAVGGNCNSPYDILMRKGQFECYFFRKFTINIELAILISKIYFDSQVDKIANLEYNKIS